MLPGNIIQIGHAIWEKFCLILFHFYPMQAIINIFKSHISFPQPMNTEEELLISAQQSSAIADNDNDGACPFL